MIALLTGVLRDQDGDTIVVETAAGMGYRVSLPLGVVERLPALGARVTLHTELVVRDDGWSLYGFDRPAERAVFQRLLGASGFGPRLALALLSTLGADRTVRSIQQKDLGALSTVPGIGRKKAERLVLELSDRFADLTTTPPGPGTAPGQEAVQALVALGYAPAAAEDAVRQAVRQGDADTETVVRRALPLVTRKA